MKNIYTVLEEIKAVLGSVTEIKSLKIGLEKGADSAINTPLIRLVVEKVEAKGAMESLIVQVVLAFDTKNDYEKLYENFYNKEFEVKNIMMKNLKYQVSYLGSVSDEDRLNSIKAGLLRFRIDGINFD